MLLKSMTKGLSTVGVALALILSPLCTALGGEGGRGSDDGPFKELRELKEIDEKRRDVVDDIQILKAIDYNNEFREFASKKKVEDRLKFLRGKLKNLNWAKWHVLEEQEFLRRQFQLKLFVFLNYFVMQTYLGLPPAPTFPPQGLSMTGNAARTAYAIMFIIAIYEPIYTAYMTARWLHIFGGLPRYNGPILR